MMGELNDRLKNLEPNKLVPGDQDYVTDLKLEFILRQIHFYDDPGDGAALWDWTDGVLANLGKWAPMVERHVTLNTDIPVKDDAIHVFFVEEPLALNDTRMQGVACGIVCAQSVVMWGPYDEYLNASSNTARTIAGVLAHEFFHCLGLGHAFGNDGCQDTPDTNDCWCGPDCSNNYMDYNCERSNVSKCQACKMLGNLRNVPELRKLVIPNCVGENLVLNGSFEGDCMPLDIVTLFPGETCLLPWEVISPGNVDVVGPNHWVASRGGYSVELAGNVST